MVTKTKKLNKLCAYFHNTSLFDCPKCGVQLRDFYAELKAKCDAVPRELKQKLLDNLKDKNIGDAIKATDPDGKYEDVVWFKIIDNQIDRHTYHTFNHNVK